MSIIISDKEVNDPETTPESRANYLLYENQFSASYQSNHNYHQTTSLYFTTKDDWKTKLIIYESENQREKTQIVDTPSSLNYATCITQLPNGELFCFGSNPDSGITLTIDRNFKVRTLPSGVLCGYSSCIYFNGKIYCFGGQKYYFPSSLSQMFDLNDNRWINLTPMPQDDIHCYSAIVNRNILISGYDNENLLLYSTDIDSFSMIPYEFTKFRRKILINAERLYVIECGRFIYESKDEYHWQTILDSIIIVTNPIQAYCSYNKGAIYIGIYYYGPINYYKFDLNQKSMIELK